MATIALNLGGLFLSTGGINTAFGLGAASLLFASNTEGPRLGLRDRSPAHAQLGQPIPKPFGLVPLTGQIVWATKLQEHPDTQSAGKGGPTVTNYTYTGSATWLLGLGTIDGLKKIRVGSKVLWDGIGTEQGLKGYLGNPVGGHYFNVDSATGTWTSQSGKVIIRMGTDTQMPTAAEQTDKGIASTPAYRGRVTITMLDIPLKYFGNQYPEVNALANEGTTIVSDVAEWVCNEAGLNVMTQTDMCQLATTALDGFLIDQRSEAREWLNQLATAYQCSFPDRNGRLTAWKRGYSPALTLTDEQVRVVEAGQTTPELSWTRARETELPSEINVAIYNPAREYTVDASARAWREISGVSQQKETITLSMAMSQPRARRIAEIELYRRAVEREGPILRFGPEHAWLECGDSVIVPTTQGLQPVLLTSQQPSLLGAVQWNTVNYDADIYDFPLSSDAGALDPAVVESADGFVYVILDANSYQDSDNGKPFLYIAGATPNGQAASPTRFKCDAFDENSDGRRAADLTQKAILGVAVGTIGSWSGGSSGFDNSNTLTVDMIFDRSGLASVTDAQIATGANRALYGREIIQWGTASYVGAFGDYKRYQLSHLKRGVRGSESFINTHATNEAFLVLDAAVKRAPYTPSVIGQSITIETIDEQGNTNTASTTPYAHNLWPYSVASLTASRDGSGNISASWTRRSRYAPSGGGSVILGEQSEKYEIDVVNGSTIVRTLQTTSPSLSYTVAAQTADGLTTSGTNEVQNIATNGTYSSGSVSVTGAASTQTFSPGDSLSAIQAKICAAVGVGSLQIVVTGTSAAGVLNLTLTYSGSAVQNAPQSLLSGSSTLTFSRTTAGAAPSVITPVTLNVYQMSEVVGRGYVATTSV